MVNAACRRDYTARYYRLDDLANQLAVFNYTAPARLKFLQDFHSCDKLVLNDFLTTLISSETATEVGRIRHMTA